MPASQTGVPQAADTPFPFQQGRLKPASKSASSGYLACIHLRADRPSEASISLCICLNTSQEVGAAHAVAANISDTEPKSKKQQEETGRNWKPRHRSVLYNILLPSHENLETREHGNAGNGKICFFYMSIVSDVGSQWMAKHKHHYMYKVPKHIYLQ